MSGFNAEPKDHQRIANVYGRSVSKGAGKVLQLARDMASKITDPRKACRRGDAAWHFQWHGMPVSIYEAVARIFYTRASELFGGAYEPEDNPADSIWKQKLAGPRPGGHGELIAFVNAPPPPKPAPLSAPSKRKIKL